MQAIEATTKFRLYVLISSMISATVTILILISNQQDCEGANLLVGLWLLFSVHFVTFFLLLFHFIGCGSCLRHIGRLLGLYYFYMVGAMFATQVFFFQGKNCHLSTPVLYLWIAVNILIFYVIVAYGIALWGSYICWESEKEEKIVKESMKQYMKEEKRKQKRSNDQLMLGQYPNDAKKSLLALENGDGKKKKKAKKQRDEEE